MTTTMIQTEGLTKHFTVKKDTVEAVRGIDLRIERGEMVALLGPNGAGKSTTLRMLTTLIQPTAGRALVAGLDVTQDQAAVRRQIGYIGQGNGAGHNQRGRDELATQGRMYGLSKADALARADELVASLDLSEVADRKVSALSGGQRRRLDIAMGLIHSPDLLFLDEPSTGLDPQNRANLQEHIVALRERHDTTIVLTTHYLDEADSLAERVVVVDHGLIVADDTPARLKAEFAGDRITVTFASPDDAALAAGIAIQVDRAAITELNGTRLPSTEHPASSLFVRVVDGPTVLPRLLHACERAGVRVLTAELARPTLDDVFLNLTGRSLREGRSSTEAATETASSTETAPSIEPAPSTEAAPSTVNPQELSA